MTADYVDPELGGHVSFIISTDRTPIDVGTYTATVIGVDGNTNYEIVGNIQTTYDIFPMRFDNVSTDFDMSTFQFTFTVDDAVSGDDVRILFKLYKDGVEVDKVDGPGYYEAKFVGLTGADAANYSYRGDEVLVFEEISQESWDEVTGGSDQGND